MKRKIAPKAKVLKKRNRKPRSRKPKVRRGSLKTKKAKRVTKVKKTGKKLVSVIRRNTRKKPRKILKRKSRKAPRKKTLPKKRTRKNRSRQKKLHHFKRPLNKLRRNKNRKITFKKKTRAQRYKPKARAMVARLKRAKRAKRTKKKIFKRKNFKPKFLIRKPNAQSAQQSQELVVLPDAGPPGHLVTPNLTTQDLIRPNEALQQAMKAFLMDQRSEHTQRAYGKDLKRFMKFLLVHREEWGVKTIDRSVIIAYKDSLLEEKLEHTTIDRHLATLRSFFGWLVDEGTISKSPAEGVRFLNPKRLSKTLGFSDEEVRKVLSKPNLHTRTGAQHYAILMVLFYCGIRRSEVCSLRTRNIGMERGQPVLRLRGKGNAERLIVLIPPVWQALKYFFRIMAKDPKADSYVFSPLKNNRTGVLDKPLDPSMIFYIVRKYAKLGGIANRVSPHSCRATAISNARDHDVPDRAIQEFAGWASPDMITRYDKRKNSVEKSAAHAIDYGSKDRGLPNL